MGICCDDAGACLETEGVHRQVPDESPKRLHYSVQITGLLKRPLTGTISCEKITYLQIALLIFIPNIPPSLLWVVWVFSLGNNTVFSGVTSRDSAIPVQSSCSEARVCLPI